MKKNFLSIYGPWALIAGASAGIGAAYAEELAKTGMNLVLIARREAELGEAARRIALQYSVSVKTVRLDLSTANFVKELEPQISGLDIGLVICNAAYPAIGKFLEQSMEDHMRLLDINCRAVVKLAHYFGTVFKNRGRGGMIFMSSLSAFFGSPFMSLYGASKAFTLALGEGLEREFKEHNIDLLIVCPGATRTENFTKSIPKGGSIAGIPIMKPSDVANGALLALGKRDIFIPGILNGVFSFFMRKFMTRKAAVGVMMGSSEQMYGIHIKSKN